MSRNWNKKYLQSLILNTYQICSNHFTPYEYIFVHVLCTLQFNELYDIRLNTQEFEDSQTWTGILDRPANKTPREAKCREKF